MEKTKTITGVGLLLAIMIVFQSLRIFIPLPPWINTFIIGSLVNTCLVIAFRYYGFSSSFLLGIIAPLMATLQGLLIHPLLAVPVALANILYVVVVGFSIRKFNIVIGGLVGGVVKMAILWVSFYYLLSFLQIKEPIIRTLLFVMSWPQVFTGFMGVILSSMIMKKLEKSKY